MKNSGIYDHVQAQAVVRHFATSARGCCRLGSMVGSVRASCMPICRSLGRWRRIDADAESLARRQPTRRRISSKASIDDKSEKLRAFTIQPTKGRRAFYDLGLRPRDLVTAVNGTTVVDQDRAHSQEIVDAMLRAGPAIITIIRRNGQPQ